MNVKPLGSRVLIKLLEEEEKRSPRGIVLPDTAKTEKVLRGEVLAVGSVDEKIEAKPGDVVLVPRYVGTELDRKREKLLIVKAADILAVVEER